MIRRSACGWLVCMTLWLGGPAQCLADELWVSTTRDDGPGSLRQAITAADRTPGPDRIRFDSKAGPFAAPRRIRIERALPVLSGELEIDGYIEDRLWEPTGVTLDAQDRFRVFELAPDSQVTLRHLNVTGGRADLGGGLLVAGNATVDSMAFFGNQAGTGGAVAQRGGRLRIVNSSFWDNRGLDGGGAVAVVEGEATLLHATIAGNQAPKSGGLLNQGRLRLSNTILANSIDGDDCVSTAPIDPASSHNLIEKSQGCGMPFTTADPALEKAGLYNGPTQTLPLRGGSPAINQADPAASVSESGEPLKWDQRGNGDPRFAAGIPDIGAFEEQAVTVLDVDIDTDLDVRGCSNLPRDCSLRGAVEIANASARHDRISFSPELVRASPALRLNSPLPRIRQDLVVAAPPGLQVELFVPGGLVAESGRRVELEGVQVHRDVPAK